MRTCREWIRLLCLLFAFSAAGEEAQKPDHWRLDFNAMEPDRKLPDETWEFQGGKMFVPKTQFIVRKHSEDPAKQVLSVEIDKSTGAMLFMLSDHVDLQKTPILRWRWRVHNLPKGADGRDPAKDDQPIAVYFGAGGALARRSVGYRWETETPLDSLMRYSYGGGIVKILTRSVRNKSDAVGEWHTEERDVAADFEREFGYLPKEFILSIGGNGQYTNSVTRAEIEFFEMVPRDAVKLANGCR